MAAPPAFSPSSAAATEPQDAGHAANQAPEPLKGLPADPNTAQQQVPASAAVPPAPAQVATPLDQLGDSPQWIDCPFCHRRTLTRVSKEGTSMQILAGILCCLFCVCLACVPCLAGWFEETIYVCTQCNKKVATRPVSGPIIVHGPQATVPSK
ncbi:765d9350-c5c3-45d8-8a6d-b886477d322e [Thermothielavioides terrestris]|uniref:LITAF domain-containing protein n=2 Tax=Thermothielavioides terrestris TaxID=2587410 RepID=G2QUW3_THETT|nr:uncharacterized protein THITE_2109351 [Thermothielavioides terrestris NRRL 8126]AEO63758.1 hypothetical protein THITE_2109351 [Thermothielavioides terrestris NRRL 8126]SPQ23510.1 765d9350-c5c3-45d8-8a6d-b886477d322e [Thermothielavioides terrestris]